MHERRGRLVAALALAVVCAACVWLARWQLERAATNRSLGARFAAGATLPPLSRPVEDAGAALYRRMELEGRYVPEPQVLLDNRVRHGAAGFDVLTAFALEGDPRRVLVDRGWIALGERRERLPDVAVDAAPRTLEGRVATLPRAGLKLAAPAEPAGRAVYVMSYPGFAEVEAALGSPLYGFVLLADGDATARLETDWPPPPDSSARNLGYAGQWSLFALMAGGTAVWLVLPARFRRARSRLGP